MTKATIGFLVGCLLCLLAWPPAHAAKYQLVVGETYLFVVDCLPSAVIQNANPCYVERVTVKQVYDDGSVDVSEAGEPTGMVWRVNLARVYAVAKVARPNRRAA